MATGVIETPGGRVESTHAAAAREAALALIEAKQAGDARRASREFARLRLHLAAHIEGIRHQRRRLP
jgi:molybdopterin-guanine dinucleotide biosynthesis protein A